MNYILSLREREHDILRDSFVFGIEKVDQR